MVAATAEGCTDDQVVAYDADADLFYCKADSTGAGGDQLVDIVATSPLLVNAGTNVDDALPGADADITWSIGDAAADGSTKGASTYTANDFDAASGVISLDYANGQAATSGQDGFMQSAQVTALEAIDTEAELEALLEIEDLQGDLDPDRLSGDAGDDNLIAHEIGGLEADVSAYAGLVHITGGTTSAKTIGIANDNIVEIDDAGNAASGEIARFTANGIEGVSSVTGNVALAQYSVLRGDATNKAEAVAISDNQVVGRAGGDVTGIGLATAAADNDTTVATAGAVFDERAASVTLTNKTINGATLTGAHDAGGATSFEFPNGTDPDVDAAGEISYDTDDNTLRGYDGSAQVALGMKTHTIHVTVVSPNDLDDATRDKFMVWSNESGFSFIVTKVEAWSDTTATAFVIDEYDADGASNTAEIDGDLNCATGSGPYTDTETDISNATVEADHTIFIDFDDTDDPGWVKISISGYFNADVD
jgi:hypothetical protein